MNPQYIFWMHASKIQYQAGNYTQADLFAKIAESYNKWFAILIQYYLLH